MVHFVCDYKGEEFKTSGKEKYLIPKMKILIQGITCHSTGGFILRKKQISIFL